MGIIRVSTEKKFRPVGSTSGRPRDGAPLGPGGTKRPARPRHNWYSSCSPHASRRGRRSSSTRWSTARVCVHPPAAAEANSLVFRSPEASNSSSTQTHSFLPIPVESSGLGTSSSCKASNSMRSRVSPWVRQGCSLTASSAAGRSPCQGWLQSPTSGSKAASGNRSRASARTRLALRP